MRRSMFKSKIHRATVTDANLEYEGSITIDEDLIDAADMLPYEQIHIWNVDNGARLSTYILPGRRGSRTVCINGAAAHLVETGHRVILATFAEMDEREAAEYIPRVVVVDENNEVIHRKHVEKAFRKSAASSMPHDQPL